MPLSRLVINEQYVNSFFATKLVFSVSVCYLQAVLWRTVGGVAGGVVAIGGAVIEAPLVLAGGAAYLGVQLVKNTLTLAGISN